MQQGSFTAARNRSAQVIQGRNEQEAKVLITQGKVQKFHDVSLDHLFREQKYFNMLPDFKQSLLYAKAMSRKF